MAMQKLVLALAVSLAAAGLPTFYHTTPMMMKKVSDLEGPSCPGLKVETVTEGGRLIQVARWKERGTDSSKYKTMVVAGEHAREMIGSEIALNFVMALCGQAEAGAITEAKKDTEFLVVMNANPASRTLVEEGQFCKRINPDGVDINRNFDINWAYAETNNPDTNPGAKAFDQPEARILKKLMEDFQPHAYLDLHSGFKGMFFPNQVAGDEELGTSLQRITADIDEETCQCPLGIANKEVGYHTTGSALDYSFSVLKVPFSMAMEVYIDESNTAEAHQIKKRWDEQKAELLKPLRGSSFMENGVSRSTIVPMSFIQSGDQNPHMVNLDAESPESCLSYFNPVKPLVFEKTVKSWTNAVAKLSIQSRHVSADAAIVATKKSPNFALKQKIQENPMRYSMSKGRQSAPTNPVWFGLKGLGLLLVVYVAIKYYKVKQSKSAEAEPIMGQNTPVQVSD